MFLLKRRLATGVIVLGLALACGAAAATKTPPTIEQLDGAVLAITMTQTEYNLATGAKEVTKPTQTWTLTQEDAVTVNIHSDVPSAEDFKGHYQNGVLTIGALDNISLANVAQCVYMLVSGTPGKLKLTGEYIKYDLVLDSALQTGTISGKEIAAGSGAPGAAAVETVSAAAAATPPSIDDIVGDWAISDSWAEYAIDNPKPPEKGKSKDTFVITKTSDTEVDLVWNDIWEYRGHYFAGVLFIGRGSSVVPGAVNYIEMMYLEISGTPGKLKLKGKYLWYEWSWLLIDVETFSGKQVPE